MLALGEPDGCYIAASKTIMSFRSGVSERAFTQGTPPEGSEEVGNVRVSSPEESAPLHSVAARPLESTAPQNRRLRARSREQGVFRLAAFAES